METRLQLGGGFWLHSLCLVVSRWFAGCLLQVGAPEFLGLLGVLSHRRGNLRGPGGVGGSDVLIGVGAGPGNTGGVAGV